MIHPAPDNGNALIDEAGELPVPSQQGTAGGDLARQVGQRDEARTATGTAPERTGVAKRDRPAKGGMASPKQTRP